MSLNNLASSLNTRFEQRGVPSDLNEVIGLHRAVLVLFPPGRPRRSTFLHNLAISLHIRFQQRSITSDLDEAIEFHRAALVLRPPGHPHRSTSLTSVASSLHTGFQQRGISSDLEEVNSLKHLMQPLVAIFMLQSHGRLPPSRLTMALHWLLI